MSMMNIWVGEKKASLPFKQLSFKFCEKCIRDLHLKILTDYLIDLTFEANKHRAGLKVFKENCLLANVKLFI